MINITRAVLLTSKSNLFNHSLSKISKTSTASLFTSNKLKVSPTEKDKSSVTITDATNDEKNIPQLQNIANAWVDPKNMKNPKHWISWGFSTTDIYEDNFIMHLAFFMTITVVIVGGTFIVSFYPDHKLLDWTKREAYLEIRRREEEGLPLVNPDYVPKENIYLPTDEELGDGRIWI